MDAYHYLDRINIIEDVHADHESLRLIQLRHMLSVPFENLDIMNSRAISLDIKLIYDKIVINRRGGYCYELNGLLGWLLLTVGFSLSMVSGRVRRNDGTYGPEFDHMALIVNLDQDYIVDVGFGDSVRTPLPLTGEVVTDVSGSYRIWRGPNSEILFFQELGRNEWVTKFQFTLHPRKLEEFAEMNQYQQTSSESIFTKELVCSIATGEGRLTISDHSLIRTVGTVRKQHLIESTEELSDLLRRLFGIDMAK